MFDELKPYKASWFPFTSTEVHAVLAVYGFFATLLVFFGVGAEVLAIGSVIYVTLCYISGLLVHARERTGRLEFVKSGAIGGTGYVEAFTNTRRSLLLMHIDDDPPRDDLLDTYRKLLNRGIQIRRIVCLRPAAKDSAYDWIVKFGNHPNLSQRVVRPQPAELMQSSFAVIDDNIVIISVPGWEAIDSRPYVTELIFRHLLVMRDRTIASIFLRMHRDLWDHAYPLTDAKQLAHRQQLAETLQIEKH